MECFQNLCSSVTWAFHKRHCHSNLTEISSQCNSIPGYDSATGICLRYDTTVRSCDIHVMTDPITLAFRSFQFLHRSLITKERKLVKRTPCRSQFLSDFANWPKFESPCCHFSKTLQNIHRKGALDLISISDKTSHHKILWSLKAARLVIYIIASLWDLTCASAAAPQRRLANFRATRQF